MENQNARVLNLDFTIHNYGVSDITIDYFKIIIKAGSITKEFFHYKNVMVKDRGEMNLLSNCDFGEILDIIKSSDNFEISSEISYSSEDERFVTFGISNLNTMKINRNNVENINAYGGSTSNKNLLKFDDENFVSGHFYVESEKIMERYVIDELNITSNMRYNHPHADLRVPCVKGRKLIIDGYFTWTAKNSFANVLFNLCDGVTNGFNMMLDTRQDNLIYSWSTIIGGHTIPNCFNTVGASSDVIQLNKEYHIRYEYNGSTMLTYLDDKLGRVQHDADFPTTLTMLKLYFGGSVNTYNGLTSGRIRDVKILWGKDL